MRKGRWRCLPLHVHAHGAAAVWGWRLRSHAQQGGYSTQPEVPQLASSRWTARLCQREAAVHSMRRDRIIGQDREKRISRSDWMGERVSQLEVIGVDCHCKL